MPNVGIGSNKSRNYATCGRSFQTGKNTDSLPEATITLNSRFDTAISLLGLFLALLQKALDGRSLERSNRVKKGLISVEFAGNSAGSASF